MVGDKAAGVEDDLAHSRPFRGVGDPRAERRGPGPVELERQVHGQRVLALKGPRHAVLVVKLGLDHRQIGEPGLLESVGSPRRRGDRMAGGAQAIQQWQPLIAGGAKDDDFLVRAHVAILP